MSKVLVDRELLEKWADKLEGADSAGYGWEDLLATEVRDAIAQPAENEAMAEHLRNLLTGEVGRMMFDKLRNGQATDTADGKAWLAARAAMAAKEA